MLTFTYPDGRLTPHSASQYLGLSQKTLAQWRYQGRGPLFTKLSGRVFYFVKDLEEWITAQGKYQTTVQARILKGNNHATFN